MTPSAPVRTDDLAWLLLRYGYAFSAELRRRRGLVAASAYPAVPVTLLGSPAVLLGGPEGVREFTDTDRFAREGATPAPVGHLLFGNGPVHDLDGEAHRRRKELFVDALAAPAVDDLVARVARAWRRRLEGVVDGGEVVVMDAAARLVGEVVQDWAGVPTSPDEAAAAADRFAAILDGFGVPGPAYLRAWRARTESDAWAAGLVRRVRDGGLVPPAGTALSLAAWWRDEAGDLLTERVAGVELQNVLRPTVAVSRLVAFAALALTGHPQWREALRDEHAAGGASLATGARGRLATAFAREVRRLAPFVPLLAARSRADGQVLGLRVPAGRRVFLDVVGTLRDPAQWPEPMVFSPERFLGDAHVTADALVPQGGGSVLRGHRCPGEDPALGILTVSSTALALVADEVLGRRDVDERRFPADPAGGVRLRLHAPD